MKSTHSFTIEKIVNMAINPNRFIRRQHQRQYQHQKSLSLHFQNNSDFNQNNIANLIAFPVQKRRLKKGLNSCQCLGDTADGKLIFLTNKQASTA